MTQPPNVRLVTEAALTAALAGTATSAQITTAIDQLRTDLLAGAPGALDTLNELAAALGNDSNYATTIAATIATKAPLPAAAKNALTGWFHASGYGAAYNGSNDAPAINAAIAAASAAGGGEVYLEGPSTVLASIAAKTKVTLRGPVGTRGRIAKLIAGTGITTAVILGSSGDTVTGWHLRDISIDGGWATNPVALNGVQITNGDAPLIQHCDFTNLGGSGILLSGLNAAGGTPNARIHDNTFTGIGLANGTTGFGVNLRGSSHYASIERNTFKNIVGGMGIGGAGDATILYPTGCTVTNNWITMAASTTGFEPIGITAGCDRWIITGNHLYNAQDNGISVSSSWNVVTGNYIDAAYNSGIAISGNYNQVSDNLMKNAGQQADATYGFISLYSSAARNTITGNTGIDDQATHTTSFGIKGVLSGGSNWIEGNTFTGLLSTATTGLLSADTFIDRDTNAGTFAVAQGRFTQLKGPDDSTALIFGNSARLTGISFGGTSTIGAGQINFGTNVPATRPNATNVAVFGQAANMHEWSTSTAQNVLTVVGRVTKTGRIASTDGLTTKNLGDITGLSNTQIDALFLATPDDGTIATATLSGSALDVTRTGGVWVPQASTAYVTTGLALKAPLASPALTGTPTAPTPATADNSTTIATTAFVKAQGYSATGGGTAVNVQTFTTSGTWTKPAGVTTVQVTLIGAGGGGGSGRRQVSGTIAGGGGGGGGGGMSTNTFPAAALGATVAVSVGSGGNGGAAQATDSTNGSAGTAGAASIFGNMLYANGGNAGGAGSTTGGSAGGTASSAMFSGNGAGAGGAGAAGAQPGSTPFGGAGGGGGGGISTTPAAFNGGTGGAQQMYFTGASAAGGTAPGGAGATGNGNAGAPVPGCGAGGGASSITGAGGAGGVGGTYGGGGGGGGASLNGFASGAGGQGGSGIVVVTSW